MSMKLVNIAKVILLHRLTGHCSPATQAFGTIFALYEAPQSEDHYISAKVSFYVVASASKFHSRAESQQQR